MSTKTTEETVRQAIEAAPSYTDWHAAASRLEQLAEQLRPKQAQHEVATRELAALPVVSGFASTPTTAAALSLIQGDPGDVAVASRRRVLTDQLSKLASEIAVLQEAMRLQGEIAERSKARVSGEAGQALAVEQARIVARIQAGLDAAFEGCAEERRLLHALEAEGFRGTLQQMQPGNFAGRVESWREFVRQESRKVAA